MMLPEEPRRGRPIEADWGARVVRYLRWLTPGGGPRVLVNGGGPNLTISAMLAGRGGRAARAVHPFQMVKAMEGSSLGVRFRRGTVNSVVARWNGVALPADFAESPFVPIAANTDFWIRVELDESGQVDVVDIVTSEPAVSTTIGRQLLGSVVYHAASGGMSASIDLDQQVKAALSHASCGSTHIFGRV